MRAVWPIIYRKSSFPACASDRQSCTQSREDDQRQLLEAEHGPPSGSKFLASRVLLGSAVTAGHLEKVFPLKAS